jgi:hypothetical protein
MGLGPTIRRSDLSFVMLALVLLSPNLATARGTDGDLCQRLINLTDSNRPGLKNIFFNSEVGPKDEHGVIKRNAEEVLHDALENYGPSSAIGIIRDRHQTLSTELEFIATHQNQQTSPANDPIRFSAITSSEDLQIQRTVRGTRVNDVVAHRNKRNPSQEDKDWVQISQAIDHIQSGMLITPKQIEAVRMLRNTIKAFEGSAAQLQSKSTLQGENEMMVARFLKNNDTKFRRQLTALTPGQSLFISLPKVTRVGENQFSISSEVKSFTSLDAYDIYFNSTQLVAREITNLSRLRKMYKERYLFARALARQLPGTTPENTRSNLLFSLDSHIDAEERKIIIEYEKLVKDISTVFDHSLPIHPSPESLRAQSRETNAIHRFRKVTAVAAGALIAGLGYIGTAESIEAKLKRANSLKEDAEDAANAFVSEYWIKKCSSKTTATEIDQCVDDFSNTLATAIERRVLEKRIVDPNYDDIQEKADADTLIITVVNGTYSKLPTRLYIELNTLAAKKYGKEAIYHTAKLEVIKKQQEQQFARLNPALASDTPSPPKSGGSITRDAHTSQIESIKKEYGERGISFNSNIDAQSASPKAVVASRINHLIYLKDAMAQLLKLKDVTTTDKADADITALMESMNRDLENEINAILASIPEAEALIKAADPTIVIPSSNGEAKIVPDSAITADP